MVERKPLVLVVDDDPLQLQVLEQAFTHLNVPWETRFFSDPTSVLLELRKNPGAVLVTDWMMPEMTGLELCHHVRSDAWHGKGFHYCILLTSRKTGHDAVQGLDEAHEFLVKPVDPKRLAAHIEVGLRMSSEKVDSSSGYSEGALPTLPTEGSSRRAALRKIDLFLDQVGVGNELSVFLCEPVGLFAIHDYFGRDVHDQILTDWVWRIQKALGSTGVLLQWDKSRYLGICEKVTKEAMEELSFQIREAVGSLPFRTSAGFFSGGLCLGSATSDSTELDSWLLLHQAEDALKQALEQGPGALVAAPMVGAPSLA